MTSLQDLISNNVLGIVSSLFASIVFTWLAYLIKLYYSEKVSLYIEYTWNMDDYYCIVIKNVSNLFTIKTKRFFIWEDLPEPSNMPKVSDEKVYFTSILGRSPVFINKMLHPGQEIKYCFAPVDFANRDKVQFTLYYETILNTTLAGVLMLDQQKTEFQFCRQDYARTCSSGPLWEWTNHG